MDGVARSSVVVGGEFATQHSAFSDLVAYLKSNLVLRNLSADRFISINRDSLLVYQTLFPAIQKKVPFPVTVTLSDQTQLTIQQTESELLFTADGNHGAFTMLTRTVLDRLYFQVRSTPDFFYITEQEDRYRALGWEGNFYYKNLPTPEQLRPNYKKTPYMTIGEIDPINLNGRAKFSETNLVDPNETAIFCRHLSTKCAVDVATDKSGQGKFSLDKFQDEQSITNHVTVDLEELHSRWHKNGLSYDLIDNDSFGSYLEHCFQKMGDRPNTADTGGGNKIKAMLVESTNHTMMLRLRMKWDEDGNPIYVVKFYEPNITNKTIRVETNDLATLESHSLKHYIAGTSSPSPDSNYFTYFQEDAQISMIVDCDADRSINSERKLNSTSAGPISAHHIFYLLEYNFFQDVSELTMQLEAIGRDCPENLMKVLAAKVRKGYPTFNIMAQVGNAEGIKTYGELILTLCKFLTREQIMELLAASRTDGVTALFMLGQEGYTDAMNAYGDVILKFASILSPDQIVELFAAFDADGLPVLNVMGQLGQAEAIRVFGEQLHKLAKYIPRNELIELLAARKVDGTPALYMMVQFDQQEEWEAFRDVAIGLLSKEECETLFETISQLDESSTPGMHDKLQTGSDEDKQIISDAHSKMRQMLADWSAELATEQ